MPAVLDDISQEILDLKKQLGATIPLCYLMARSMPWVDVANEGRIEPALQPLIDAKNRIDRIKGYDGREHCVIRLHQVSLVVQCPAYAATLTLTCLGFASSRTGSRTDSTPFL